MEDEFIAKVTRQIDENKRLIAEAKQTIEKMRSFFRELGADLDSGRNIFLESENLSPEGRREAERIIGKMNREFQQRRRELRRQSEQFRESLKGKVDLDAAEPTVKSPQKRIKI